MQLMKLLLLIMLLIAGAACGKLKLLAHKGPFGGFVGVKWRKPKLLGLKHGLGGGGFHSSGFSHHSSYHSSGFGGGHFGGGGWLGK